MRSEEAMAFITEQMRERGVSPTRWCIEGGPTRLVFIAKNDKSGLPERREFRLKRSWSKQLIADWIDRNVPRVLEAAE